MTGTKLSVIIPTKNESNMIGSVMEEISKLNPFEIIVVDNGSTDDTKAIVKKHGGKVIEYPYALGRNVPRAIGAYYARGDILLFTDGDQVLSAKKLRPFIKAIEDGADITLNDFRYLLKLKKRPHCTAVARKGLNLLLNKSEHDIDSFISIPHAMNRRALEAIGWWNLAETGVANAEAMMSGLKIVSPSFINVLKNNARRKAARVKSPSSPFSITHDEILGDQALGVNYLIEKKGTRGGFSDDRLYEGLPDHLETAAGNRAVKRSAVIAATKGREASIPLLVNRLTEAKVKEIIIVTDKQDSKAERWGKDPRVQLITITGREGLFYERFAAARQTSGKSVLFMDGNYPLSVKEINRFYKKAESGRDLTLNNKGYLLGEYPMNAKTSIHYFLNILLKRPKLLNHSLTEYPHAISRKLLHSLDPEDLMKPPVAYVKAVLSGFKISAPVRVKTAEGDVRCDEVFLGDHVEAIGLLLNERGEKAGFLDGKKHEAIVELREEEGKVNGGDE